MPLNLQYGNDIVQAFAAGAAERERKEQLKLERDRLEQQKKIEEEQLAQHHEEFQVTNKMQQALHDIQILQAKQNIAENISKIGEGGVSAIGGKVTGIDYGPTGEEPKTISFQYPLSDNNVTVEHPLAKARRAAQEQNILQEPIRETQRLLQEAETKRQLQVEQPKIFMQILKDQADRLSREKIESAHDATRLAAARARGTSDKISNQAIRISQQFDTHEITKRYNLIKEASQTVNNISDNTNNPGDDQQLIYAFAKTMDPQSVVREGEYATVQKYAQSLADKFGFTVDRIFKNSPFLTPEARRNMKNTILNRAKIEQGAYENLREQTTKKLVNIGENPENWLIDYGKVELDNKPKIGDTKTFSNGKKGKWDGIGWEEIK